MVSSEKNIYDCTVESVSLIPRLNQSPKLQETLKTLRIVSSDHLRSMQGVEKFVN